MLFAFSGMDGATSWAHPMVGSTRADPLGISYPFQRATLRFGQDWQVERARLAGSDVADTDLVGPRGRAALRLAHRDRWTLLGAAMGPVEVSLDAGPEAAMALATRSVDGGTRFALALSPRGAADAAVRAGEALHADLDAAHAARAAFFRQLPALPDGVDGRTERLYAKACAVLKVNAMTPEGEIAHRWTTPDRWPHRDMWLWDSAFHAPAYALLDPAWGEGALLAVLDRQDKETGFIAHQMRPQGRSRITQPPILAWSCWHVYRITGRRELLEAAYPGLCRYLEWDLAHRDWNGDGLLGWLIEGNPLCRSGESGMDNSSRFDPDGPWDNVDLNAYVVNEMGCLARIARELGRDAEGASWEARAKAMAARVNALLWDAESGFYYDRHADGKLLTLKSNAGFLPLLAGIATPGQAARLVAHLRDPARFWTAMPVPTIALDEPAYAPDMWRGPTWVNVNGLIREGLARYGYDALAAAIRRKTLDEIARWYEARGCIYEYYDCLAAQEPRLLDRKGAPGTRGGTGFGVIADYNWTAAWVVRMLLEGRDADVETRTGDA
jgi:hypothetical protein